jgi:hypothetical protein
MKEGTVAAAAFLQYGALGLLALVLVGLGVGGYFFLNYFRDLIEVMRKTGEATAAAFARFTEKLDQISEEQERTSEELKRAHEASSQRDQQTHMFLMRSARMSPPPFPAVKK